MVEGRSPDDTQEVDTREVLRSLHLPKAAPVVEIEQSRRAFIELLTELGGEVVKIDDVEDEK